MNPSDGSLRKEGIGPERRMVQATDELRMHGYWGFQFTDGKMFMVVRGEADAKWFAKRFGIQHP